MNSEEKDDSADSELKDTKIIGKEIDISNAYPVVSNVYPTEITNRARLTAFVITSVAFIGGSILEGSLTFAALFSLTDLYDTQRQRY